MMMLSYSLMAINLFGAGLLLFFLRNGLRPDLAGIRWMLRILALIPMVGVTFNLLIAFEVVTLAGIALIRICVGYILIGSAIWGFVFWLQRRPPAYIPPWGPGSAGPEPGV